MKLTQQLSVYGIGGDALMAPEHTETAFWAALAGGAQGFVSGVRLSKDNVVICYGDDNFESCCGVNTKAEDLSWEEIEKLDPGKTFRSTVLNANGQPSGAKGLDTPWEGNLPKKKALRIPQLSQMLILFARRCQIMLHIPSGNQKLIDYTLKDLKKYGALERCILLGDAEVCTYIKSHAPQAICGLMDNKDGDPVELLTKAEFLNAEYLYLDWDQACISEESQLSFNDALKDKLEHSFIRLLLGSERMPYTPTADYYRAINKIQNIEGILSKGVIPVVENLSLPSLIAEDDFKGQQLDNKLWSAGYSHINRDTDISQDDGLHIHIREGGSYSGAAAVCLIPIHQRFDAQAGFHVGNPQQGTTFEMAAICIDPGYYHTNNEDLNTRNVNLTFDVHGAPPYASSERDENDGFRCGWNNGFNLTKFGSSAPGGSEWEAASVNMYNKYGRDVGNGDANNPEGTLRLIRNGQVFASYYRDKYNSAWVCSGVMLVQNMADDVYIRLAAKHWNKGGKPAPGNDVWFYHFKLYQF